MKAFGAMILALALAVVVAGYLYRDNQRMANEVAALQETVDTMARENSLAAQAMQERAKVYDSNTRMLLETERVLQNAGDFCRQCVPDDVRRLLKAGEDADGEAAGDPFPGDPDPKP